LDDRRFPWVMLVPRRDGIEELFELTPPDRGQLMEEICAVSAALKRRYAPFRLNIADIGNLAYQLHVHIVCRFEDDAFWPKTVWSREREPYTADARAARQTEMRRALTAVQGFAPAAS
jgi:diadenosine tetraphosphate (Ap4A) HIT family hydrolase